jgi:hypothetical protein
VDENGTPRGAFGLDQKGEALIETTDSKGRALVPRFMYQTKSGFVGFFETKTQPSVVPPQ